jgi:hypothetical protein
VTIVLALLIMAFRDLFQRVHFARARRRGDSNAIGYSDDRWSSEASRLFLESQFGKSIGKKEGRGPARQGPGTQ